MNIDTSEVMALAADLGRVSGKALPLVDAVVEKAALNIKNEMRADAAGSRHFRFAPSISYDPAHGFLEVAYEVGPDRAHPAARLANIAYFGGSHGGGGSLDINKPVRSEEPRMMAALDKALGELL